MLEHRNKITPQMKDYDGIGTTWCPYTMFFHEANFVSASLNTDANGFRIVPSLTESNAIDGEAGAPGLNILTGGSTAFGVGATSDHATVSAQLVSQSRPLWQNIAGRAFNSTQELINFLLNNHQYQKIDAVVALTGVNNLVLHFMSDGNDENESFYFASKYYQAMQKQPASLRASIRKFIYKTILYPFFGHKIDYAKFTRAGLWQVLKGQGVPESLQIKKRKSIPELLSKIENAYTILERDIINWKRLSVAMNFDFFYVLQPLAGWVDKSPAPEEEKLFGELDAIQGESWRILKDAMNLDLYQKYTGRIQDICSRNEIPFLDLNAELSGGRHNGEWLFVDRVHLTDLGQQVVANYIKEKLLC